jgi:hypothetical protein
MCRNSCTELENSKYEVFHFSRQLKGKFENFVIPTLRPVYPQDIFITFIPDRG